MNKIFVVSGPSGVGKKTLLFYIHNNKWFKDRIKSTISFTTRFPRMDELENIDYKFVSKEFFFDLIHKRELVEWNCIAGDLYGTSASDLYSKLKISNVVLEVNFKGFASVRNHFSFVTKKTEVIGFFITIGSLIDLKSRLIKRHHLSENYLMMNINKKNKKKHLNSLNSTIEFRIKMAVKEIFASRFYPFVLLNRDFKVCLILLTVLFAIISTDKSISKKLLNHRSLFPPGWSYK